MTAIQQQDFADAVRAMVEPDSPFKPTAIYIPEGDCLEFVVSPEDYYGERVDGRITIYRGRETKEIVGVVIKGWRILCDRIAKNYFGRPAIIHGKTAKLQYMLVAHVLSLPKPEKRTHSRPDRAKLYRNLLQKAEAWNVRVPMCRSRARTTA